MSGDLFSITARRKNKLIGNNDNKPGKGSGGPRADAPSAASLPMRLASARGFSGFERRAASLRRGLIVFFVQNVAFAAERVY